MHRTITRDQYGRDVEHLSWVNRDAARITYLHVTLSTHWHDLPGWSHATARLRWVGDRVATYETRRRFGQMVGALADVRETARRKAIRWAKAEGCNHVTITHDS